MSHSRYSSNSSKSIRKSSTRRRIRPFRLFLVIAAGLGLVWGFLWIIVKFVMLLWGLLSQIHLFPPRETLDPIPNEETTLVEEVSETEVSTSQPTVELPPVVTTYQFPIVPSGMKGTTEPFSYNEVQSLKILALKEQAMVGDLQKGVLFKTGLIVQLSDVAWVETDLSEGIKLTYQLTNTGEHPQTLSQSLESSWMVHLLSQQQVLKEQLSFYDETVTAIYPFQYLTQSYKNNYAIGYQFDETERSCNDVLTLNPNEATTCSLVYDFVGTGTYDILIHQGEESYQIPIILEHRKENPSEDSSNED